MLSSRLISSPSPNFIDPFSDKIMSNPIRLGCGHSFEGKSIQQWFHLGYQACPIDEKKVLSHQITYNEPLNQKIRSFIAKHPECLHGSCLEEVDRKILFDVRSALQSPNYGPLRRRIAWATPQEQQMLRTIQQKKQAQRGETLLTRCGIATVLFFTFLALFP